MGNLELRGTLEPFEDFDAEADCKALRDACRGIGTNEDEVIDVLANRTNEQRQEIQEQFKSLYGEDLLEKLEGELRGDFEKVIKGLLWGPAEYDARTLRDAMQGAGTDEEILVEVLCLQSNERMEALKEKYTEVFERNLEEDVEGETSGACKRLLVALLQANRDDSLDIDPDQAQADAQELYDAGEGRWGTDELAFNAVLASRNILQLRATFHAYSEISEGTDIEECIESETSGTLQDAYLAIVRFAKSPAAYIAERIYRSLKGAGTDEDTLMRTIIKASELHLANVKEAFEEKYETPLSQWIDEDCGGDFKKVLIALIR